MKPRNDYQRNIIKMFEQNGGQQAISKALIKWATSSKVLDHYAFYTKKGGWCTHCGCDIAVSGEEGKTMRCPICGEVLTIKKSTAKSHSQCCYVQELTTCKGYQLVRTYLVDYYLYRGNTPDYAGSLRKVVERWIDAEGKQTILKQKGSSFPYYRRLPWANEDSMTIARESEWTKGWCVKHYPISKVLPQLKRKMAGGAVNDTLVDYNDFMAGFFGNWNVFETLWKQKMTYLAYLCVAEPYMIEDYWAEIKIALRHGYGETLNGRNEIFGYRRWNYRTWKDLIDNLRAEHMDTHNPKHICPADLQAYEQEILHRGDARRERERRILQEQREIAELEQAMTKNDLYIRMREKFFEFTISDDKYEVHALRNVKEFLDEALAMHHCVYSCAYYDLKKHPYSLILSVRNKQGGREVTIVYNLKTDSISQCYAKYDLIHEDDAYIRNLVMSHRDEIRVISNQENRKKTKRVAA